MAAVKTEPSVRRVLELLVPRYTDAGDVSGSVPVSLDLSASLDVQLVFWERSGVAKELECVNFEEGCPRCKFESFLRGLVILKRRGVLHINGAYLVEGDFALLRLQIEGLADIGAASKLEEFDFVRSHLQLGDDARAGGSEKDRADAAKLSRCHVLGCTMHRWKASRPERAKASRPVQAVSPTSPRTSVHARATVTPVNSTPRENVTAEREELGRSRSLTEVASPPPSIDGGRSPRGNNLVLVEPLRNRKLNLPDVFVSLMTRVDAAPMELWSENIPGMDLKLYEHQRRGLSWMMKREKPSLWETILQHPFRVSGRKSHESDQLLESEYGATAYDACGGMLCDEPGLGKTITMLALILLTKGQSTRDMPVRVYAPTANTANVQLRSSSRGPTLRAGEMVSSSACLIVAPDALVEHWEEQIEAHVIHRGLKTYVDRLTNLASALPKNNKLARFDVVIVSFSRMVKEWKLHRPPSALEAQRTLRYGFEDQPDRYLDGSIRGIVSSLLSIHWLRVVVDEGHKLGGRAPTQLMQICRLLCAERRWVMTGTPSPNTLQSADLQYIHGLLVFLRNQPYGRPDGFAWSKAIARPFQRDEPVGFYRLQNLLSRIMIRHTKDSIRDKLPRPIRHTVVVDPTPSEFKLYNAIAECARANLVVTSIDLPGSAGPSSNIHPKSLMHRINRQDAGHIETALAFAFMGGYAVNWTVDAKLKARTLEKMRSQGVGESRLSTLVEYLSVADAYVKGVLQTKKTRCGECGTRRRILMVLPCGHLCCAYCINEFKQELGECRCNFCDAPYDEDTFSYLQPTLTNEVTARGRDSTLGKLRRYGVSEAKIVRVAAYMDTLKPKPATECLSCHRKLHLLLIMTCGHLSCPDCVEKRFQRAGPSCTLCHQPFSRTGFRDLQPRIRPEALEDDDKPARRKKPRIPTTHKRKRATPAPKRAVNYKRDYWQIDSSKAFYMVTRIRELMKEFSNSGRGLKVIIFSQFRESIWRAKVAFRQQDIPTADFIALINPRERIRNLEAFRSNPNVHVLLLSNLGSHGLDLSFVSHIFLLEEIWDKSVEIQVISRAHRMGASHSVVVEQLWMRGTVECQLTSTNQQLFKSEHSSEDTEGMQHQPTREEVQEASSADKNSFQHLKMNYILNNLRVLEDDIVGKDGEVRFSVRDESETVIRQGMHTMSDSGEVTTVTTMHNPSQNPVASLAPARPSDSPQRRPVSTTAATRIPRTIANPPEVIVIDDSSDDECNGGGNDSEEKCEENAPVVPVRKPHQDAAPVKQEPLYIEIKDEETESE